MKSKFESYIKDHLPSLFKERSIVCCSAGIDSIVLFHLMLSINKNFVVAHCNYKLRADESDLDEKFVKTLCKKYSIKFFSKTFDTAKIKKHSKKSIQMIARDLRYEFFDEISKSEDIKHILTAHHINDSLETFLINISRGSGLDGLVGIPSINKKIKRPLIDFEKKDIMEYATTNNLTWREDSSNSSNSYLRNQFRNKIIPELEKLEGDFFNNFKKTLSYLKLSNLILHEKIDEYKKNFLKKNSINSEIILKISDLNMLNKKVFLYYFLRDYGFVDWDKILNLSNGESGKKIISDTHIFFKRKDTLVLRPKKIKVNENISIDNIKSNVKFENGELTFSKANIINYSDPNIITVDRNKLIFPLKLRSFLNGDIFYPLGMGGKKKVGKFLKDNNINHQDKSYCKILVNGNDKIIWVLGMRLDQRFCVDDKSKDYINIKYFRTD